MLEAILIGNAGTDCVTKSNENGVFATFTVAANTRKKLPDGTTSESTTWITVNTREQPVNQYILKGTKVYVRGLLSARAYLGSDNQYHARITIRANHIELLSTRNDGNNRTNQNSGNMPF